jgi:hypothetical protein
MIKTTYSNINYLSQDYLDKFMNDLNNNITSLINSTRIDVNMFLQTPEYVKKKNFYFKKIFFYYFKNIFFTLRALKQLL